MGSPELFHCPNCNAALDLAKNKAAIVRCDYCHSMVIVPETLRGKAETPVEEVKRPEQRARSPKPVLSQAEAIAKVTNLALNGELVEAMQLYREAFPVGLREAKSAVEQAASGSPLPVPEIGPDDDMELPLAAAEEITRLAAAGNMKEAASLYRLTFDTRHVEAETAVEALGQGKSIDVARSKAKRQARATAVPRQVADVVPSGKIRFLLPAVLFFLFLISAVMVVLLLVVFAI